MANLSKALMKAIGNEIIGGGEKAIAKSATSALANAVPKALANAGSSSLRKLLVSQAPSVAEKIPIALGDASKINLYRGVSAETPELLDKYINDMLDPTIKPRTYDGGSAYGEGYYFTPFRDSAEGYASNDLSKPYQAVLQISPIKNRFLGINKANKNRPVDFTIRAEERGVPGGRSLSVGERDYENYLKRNGILGNRVKSGQDYNIYVVTDNDAIKGMKVIGNKSPGKEWEYNSELSNIFPSGTQVSFDKDLNISSVKKPAIGRGWFASNENNPHISKAAKTPKYGLDEYGLGTVDLRNLNTPKPMFEMAEPEIPPEVQNKVGAYIGEPKKVTAYHGSPTTGIENFDLGMAGKNTNSGERAIYFTDDIPTAEEFSYERLPSNSMFFNKKGKKGEVYTRQLNLKNPLDLDNLTDAQIEELYDYIDPRLASITNREDFIKTMVDARKAGNSQLIKSQLDINRLGDAGYDSFIAKMYPGENNVREYGILDPSVISNDAVEINEGLKGAEQYIPAKSSAPVGGSIAPGYYQNGMGNIFEVLSPERDNSQPYYDILADRNDIYSKGVVDDNFRKRISEGAFKKLDTNEQEFLKNLDSYIGEGQTYKGINRREERSLSTYTYATPENEMLRSGKSIDEIPSAKAIMGIMDRTVGTTGTFYRGLNSKEAAKTIEGAKVGDIYVDKGFLSTDVSKSLAKDKFSGGGVLLEIKNNIKKPGTNLSLAPYTRDLSENEMLFAPNTKMEITDIVKEGNTTVYKMKVLGKINSNSQLGNLLPEDYKPAFEKTEVDAESQAMKASKQISSGVKRVGSAEVSKIDKSTLPKGYGTVKEYISEPTTKVLEEDIGKAPRGDATSNDEYMRKVRRYIEEAGQLPKNYEEYILRQAEIIKKRLGANKLREQGATGYSDFIESRLKVYEKNPEGRSLENFKISADNGGKDNFATELDKEYSDRLGIGRSHTPMEHNSSIPGAGGFYYNSGIAIAPNWATGEIGVSNIAHERMHAWQHAKRGEWDDRVIDAIEELREDLKKHYHAEEEIKKFHNTSDTKYYADKEEQEARMLQSYLENEGYTNSWRKQGGYKQEWGDEIKPAFDKFYKKLRALSKAGVALPAIALLFGLSTNNDKNSSEKA